MKSSNLKNRFLGFRRARVRRFGPAALLAAVVLCLPQVSKGDYTSPGLTSINQYSPYTFATGQYTMVALSPTEVQIYINANGQSQWEDIGFSFAVYNSQYDVNVTPAPPVAYVPTGQWVYVPQAYPPFYELGDPLDGYGHTFTSWGMYWTAVSGPQTCQNSFAVSGTVGQTVYIEEAAYCWIQNPNDLYIVGAFDYSYDVTTYVFGTNPMPNLPNTGVLHVENPKNRFGDPVDVTSGEFYQNNVDLHVNGPLPIEVR